MNIKKIEGGLEEGVLSFSSIIFQLFSEYFQICYLGEKFSSIYPLHNKVEKRVNRLYTSWYHHSQKRSQQWFYSDWNHEENRLEDILNGIEKFVLAMGFFIMNFEKCDGNWFD